MALTELASGVPVDVMPGACDPASAALPQQPLHRCLFPGAAAYTCAPPHPPSPLHVQLPFFPPLHIVRHACTVPCTVQRSGSGWLPLIYQWTFPVCDLPLCPLYVHW